MEKEIRSFEIEFHSCADTKKIEGRAIPFNLLSPNREGFREMVSPEAVEDVFGKSDIKMLYNHDGSKGFLARNNKGKGSLNIDVHDDGVYFSFELGSDNLSTYVWERMQRGELNETSWAFTVAEDRWEKQADGIFNRIITKFDKLFDFSIVDSSYYGTEGVVKCARFAEIQEEERLANEKALEEARLAEEQKKAEEERALEEYYTNLKKDNEAYLNLKEQMSDK